MNASTSHTFAAAPAPAAAAQFMLWSYLMKTDIFSYLYIMYNIIYMFDSINTINFTQNEILKKKNLTNKQKKRNNNKQTPYIDIYIYGLNINLYIENMKSHHKIDI